ncbi:MAG: ATP-dependent Clp protease proteolytic subunit [Actinobacteria bacterium]|nr:ATP-dependent Clp protease proteolytic subunit [Actinomycetota bacterium]
MSPGWWILIAVLLLLLVPMVAGAVVRRRTLLRRRRLIRELEQSRGSRVVTLIHRQERMRLLGFAFGRFIDIEDAEQVLRAIRLTPPDMPIDLVLHTPGGLVLASDQIAYALKRHPGTVTVMVPHYAMSGGTLLALAADRILMDRDAVLGPVDPQLTTLRHGMWPAASVLAALRQDNPSRDDETLILGDMAAKAIAQATATARDLLAGSLDDEAADRLAARLSEGRWTHDYPIRFDEARELGLPVGDELPDLVHRLMRLYPQRARRPSVEFIPTPYGDRHAGRREVRP